jgi:hypothetical protein
MTETTLPFGKHKGKALGEVPGGYLAWLASACKLSAGLRDAVAAELCARGLPVPPTPCAALHPVRVEGVAVPLGRGLPGAATHPGLLRPLRPPPDVPAPPARVRGPGRPGE